MKYFAYALLIFCFSCEVGNSNGSRDRDDVKREIEKLESVYAKAINNQDTEAILSFYADSFISMPPGEPMITDRETFRQNTEAFWPTDSMTENVSFETLDVIVCHDLVIETGREKVNLKNGETTYVKYLVVWKETDEGYKIIRDIYNGDQ